MVDNTMHSSKLSCVLIGSDTLLTQCGELLLEAGFKIKLVVSDNKTVKNWAEQLNVDTHPTTDNYVEQLANLDYDYLFAITHLALIPDAAIETPKCGAINFHDGPLPEYAGLNTPMWAIMNGAEHYGITWHEMTTGIDEGDLLHSEPVQITADDTALSLNTKCFSAALDSFPQLLAGLYDNTLKPRPQDLTKRRYYGRADRPRQLGLVDWRRPAAEIARTVRGLHTGPYQNVLGTSKLSLGQTAYIVDDVSVVPSTDRLNNDMEQHRAGMVCETTDEYFCVYCADGQLLKVQKVRDLDGGKVSIAELNVQLGMQLPSPDDLTELTTNVGKAESFWTSQLHQLSPVSLPYRMQVEDLRVGDERAAISFNLPATYCGLSQETIASAFASFLARVTTRTEVSLLIAGGKLSATAAEMPSALASYAACNLTFPEHQSAAEAQLVASEHIVQILNKAPFLLDLVARQGNQTIARKLGPQVGAAVIFENCTSQPIAEVELHLGSDAECRLEFATSAYDSQSIEQLKSDFLIWLDNTANHPNLTASELDLVSPADREKLLYTLNQTEVTFDETQLMLSGFDAQVKATPDAIAVVANDQEISYADLDLRAGALAKQLRAEGVGAGTLVGVFAHRSIELMVATVGIIKAGGAYVPLDPTFPIERIAFMIEDSAMPLIVTQQSLVDRLPANNARQLIVDDGSLETVSAMQQFEAANNPNDLAYVIYTSGSTGQPKGVMLEHRNVVNFFVAMDEVIPGADLTDRSWLAVTSLSFDISILELFWTLNRGFKVVIYDEGRQRITPNHQLSRSLEMGLFMWGNDDAQGPDKYKLLLEGAKYFDQNGFSAVWTPERHFHAFGGPYPNPAVTGAAVAAITSNVKIRAGSCVVPLHHPVRIAEEWSVVDNLSNGRVEIAAASGWNPNDFILRPENHADNKRKMYEQLEQVRALWRGEKLNFEGPLGAVEVESLPRPVQRELPCWITTAGNVETWIEAGRLGLNVLTHLLGQTLDEVKEKTRQYREARASAGHNPADGRVALMLHTFVGEDNDDIRELVREPMKEYLSSSMKLAMDYAWSFPAFKRPGGDVAKPEDVDLKSLSADEVDTILDFAFERYFAASGLFGDEATCLSMLANCAEAGVDEIACLMDFGVETGRVLDSLPRLKSLRDKMLDGVENSEPTGSGQTIAELITRHDVTHLQCTPSTARMYLLDTETKQALQRVPHLLLGGEALPVSLAREIKTESTSTLSNMYGPTETTIWSTVSHIEDLNNGISIGRPIANTQLYILDRYHRPVPKGLPGELYIGGKGVARGYLNQEALTAERFFDDPFSHNEGCRMYATGDLARYRPGGEVEYLGRTDFQVKVRGYRIELGEIESRIESITGVQEAAVVVRTADEGDQRMVAYVSISDGGDVAQLDIQTRLRASLPGYMIPNEVIGLEIMPRTANGKLDRKALLEIKPLVDRSINDDAKPKSGLEVQIADLWKEVLKLDEVGLNENFFDLGGHSLLVVQLHNRLKQSIDKPVSLTDLYQYTTIATFAAFLSEGADNSKVEASATRGAQRRAQRRRKAS